jgi:hypothetical protein
LSEEGWLSRRAHVVANLLLPGLQIDCPGLTQILIELGRQIPKQLHPKSMHGRFHGQDANAVREKQSMKTTGHQAILVHKPDSLTSKISGDRFLIQRFFNPVSLASRGDPRAAVHFSAAVHFTRLPHRLVQMIRMDCVQARYC